MKPASPGRSIAKMRGSDIIGRPPGPRLWTARPSVAVVILSLLTAVYLGAAFGFAAFEVWRPEAPRASFAIYLVAIAAFIGIGLASQVRAGGAGALLLLVSFAAQALWGRMLDPQPFGGYGLIWEQARRLAVETQAGAIDWSALYAGPSPVATALYAAAITMVGEKFETLRLVAAGLWTIQVFLVWRIAGEIRELRPGAFAVALIFGLSPTMVVFGSLPGVEAVFGLFALLAVYLMLSNRRRGLPLSAFLSGVSAALAFLTHPLALGYGVALLLLLAFGLTQARGWSAWRRMLTAIMLFAVGLSVGLAPQVALNHHQTGVWSAEPGPALDYQLLLGAGRGDGYDQAALEQAGFVDASGAPVLAPEALAAANRAARRMAWERISADPVGFLTYAGTEKLRRLWGSERDMLYWSVGSPSARGDQRARELAGRYAPQLVDGAYLAILLAAALGALRLSFRAGAVSDPARWVLLLGAVVALGATQLAFLARESHHLAFTPLLALLAPAPFSRLPWIVFGRPTVEEEDDDFAETAQTEIRPRPQPQPQPRPARTPPQPAAPARTVWAGPPAAPKPPAEVDARPVEERLATVLRGMSKPKREDPRTRPPMNGGSEPLENGAANHVLIDPRAGGEGAEGSPRAPRDKPSPAAKPAPKAPPVVEGGSGKE